MPAKDAEHDPTHILRKTKERIPNIPDGILDMRGPKTLEGGYSPSQDISSAMFKAKVASFGANATGVERTWEAGTKAEQAATIKERTTKLNFAIVK